MSKHTPTPWVVGLEYGDGGGRARVIRNANFDYALNESGYISAEDAAYIVRAVNAHEGLLSLLQRIQTHIAVGCKPERGYGTAHTELAIDIDAALSAAKE